MYSLIWLHRQPMATQVADTACCVGTLNPLSALTGAQPRRF